ncbi:MAG: hypothetical protein ACU0B7_09515 [Paracoccaceae bacterium]|uniref:hypothetical protein n=1 Tax=Seohaeicola saemankumensis TaxID=481181 RepID=UPI001E57A9DF|nr:hypothetical protein [Seohaeicola saemankumensis]MCD1626177.1 hypothetical protein [Seohaeicola saemankumensis]
MTLTLRTALITGTLLVLAACAAPSDRFRQAQAEAARGAQSAPASTGVAVSGSARVGVTRTIN